MQAAILSPRGRLRYRVKAFDRLRPAVEYPRRRIYELFVLPEDEHEREGST
jgi:hypothetical protein